jgi:hypothetical protein
LANDGEAVAVVTPAITSSARRDAAITAFALGAKVVRSFTVCGAPGWGLVGFSGAYLTSVAESALTAALTSAARYIMRCTIPASTKG